MAIIRYDSNEEPITISNLDNASEQEISKYCKEVYDEMGENYEDIRNLILEDKSYDEIATNKHYYKITDGITSSSPFDKKILKNENITSIDFVDMNDFNNEENFRKCLELYYKALKLNDEFDKSYKLLETKFGFSFAQILKIIDF